MKKLTKLSLVSLFALAMTINVSAQAPSAKYYGFEAGVINTDPAQKSSANWWIQANDLFSISTERNHTENGERAMKYENKKKNKGEAIFCATYEAAGAPVRLENGEYKAECWIYLEKGDISDFAIQLPAVKFKDGKRVPEYKAASVTNPDFESPFRSGQFVTSHVESGKWVKVYTKWYLNFDQDTYIDKLDSFVNIKYPKGAKPATFYIDDIKITKVE